MVGQLVPVGFVAEHLCRSMETISEKHRNARMPSVETVAGAALVRAIKDLWKPRSDRALANKADVDPSTLSGLKKGFNEESLSALKVCEALGIDFRSALKGKVVKVSPTSQAPKAVTSDLVSLATKFVGTPDEDAVREFMEYRLAKRR